MKKILHVSIYSLVTVLLGAFAGAFCWAFFFLMNTSIGFLWGTVPEWLEQAGFPSVYYPVVFCIIGGLIIGLFVKRFGDYPEDMNAVMTQVKATGRYEYDHMGASFFGALLPLLFGGSIGPEAGLTGVIASLCTWVGDRLRAVGAEMREITEAGIAAVISAIFATPLFGMVVPVVGAADDSEGEGVSARDIHLGASKPLKVVVYIMAVVGALGAMALLSSLIGGGGGLPHFSDMAFGVTEAIWFLPLVIIGACAGWLYFPSGVLARRIGAACGDKVVLKTMLAGALLGICGVLLPYTMFAGEVQTEQLEATWLEMATFVLIATGFVKVIVTQFCLNLGWHGGHFFPIIFAGISIGFGMAQLTGADPVFCLCSVTAALLGVVMRQPVMCALLLFLVFPVKGVIVMLLAAALSALIPVPKSWIPQKE